MVEFRVCIRKGLWIESPEVFHAFIKTFGGNQVCFAELGTQLVRRDRWHGGAMNHGCIGCRMPGCREDALLYSHSVRWGYAAFTFDIVVLSQDT